MRPSILGATTAMTHEELQEYETDAVEFDDDIAEDEAEDWDEETLGLDWNEADAVSVLREVVPTRGWAD
jgi:glycerol-3-phosphate cytidylyltransferase-like family protein